MEYLNRIKDGTDGAFAYAFLPHDHPERYDFCQITDDGKIQVFRHSESWNAPVWKFRERRIAVVTF